MALCLSCQIVFHNTECIFLKPGDLCLRNTDAVCNLHLGFSFEETEKNDLMLSFIETLHCF